MAEFQEVIKEFNRMCKSNDSGPCKNCFFNGKKCESYFLKNPQESEEIIMQWSKEHPVKTNADKFREVFGMEISKTHKCFESGCPKEDQMCEDCYYTGFWNKEYEKPREM